jgi:acyl-CoA synthetase (AMP-forming)/AMP-acid ligase II
MSAALYDLPTTGAQTLRALGRYPDRVAFSWPSGSLTYRGAIELIGRMQNAFVRLNLPPGSCVAFLTSNRADTWCAGVAAQLSRLAITWLHPLGSLDDQLFQLEDSGSQVLVIDADAFRDRGAALAGSASSLKIVFTLGRADYGVNLLAAVEAGGSISPRCLAGPDDVATLNYTGGTTGKSKGVLRHHRQLTPFSGLILADFELPKWPSYLAVAPISHVAGTKVVPTLMRGGTVHMLKGFSIIRRSQKPISLRSSSYSMAPRLWRLAAYWRRSSGSDRCSLSSTAKPSAIRFRCCAKLTTIRVNPNCSFPAVSRSRDARPGYSTIKIARSPRAKLGRYASERHTSWQSTGGALSKPRQP